MALQSLLNALNGVKQDAMTVSGGVLRRGFAASLIMAVFFIAQGGTVFEISLNREGSAVQDYWAFYAAATQSLKGAAAALYDKTYFQSLFEDSHGLLWLYPPTTLLFLAPLGWLPYGIAKLIWMSSSIAVMFVTARYLTGNNRFLSIIAILSPAFFSVMFTGQLSVLFAGLLAAGLFFARTRPILAGLCLGLLTVKPQFGFVAPLFLLLTGSWRAMAVAALTAIVMAAVSIGVFGLEPWRAFAASLGQGHAEFVQSYGHAGRITLADSLKIIGWHGAPALLCSLGLAALSGALLFAAQKAGASWREMVALALILSAAAAPYFWVYDWALIVFGVLLFASTRPVLSVPAQLVICALWFAPLSPYLGFGRFAVPVIWLVLALTTWVIYRQVSGVKLSQPVSAP